MFKRKVRESLNQASVFQGRFTSFSVCFVGLHGSGLFFFRKKKICGQKPPHGVGGKKPWDVFFPQAKHAILLGCILVGNPLVYGWDSFRGPLGYIWILWKTNIPSEVWRWKNTKHVTPKWHVKTPVKGDGLNSSYSRNEEKFYYFQKIVATGGVTFLICIHFAKDMDTYFKVKKNGWSQSPEWSIVFTWTAEPFLMPKQRSEVVAPSRNASKKGL